MRLPSFINISGCGERGISPLRDFHFCSRHAKVVSLPQKGKENEEFLEISAELRYFIANSKAFLGSFCRLCAKIGPDFFYFSTENDLIDHLHDMRRNGSSVFNESGTSEFETY